MDDHITKLLNEFKENEETFKIMKDFVLSYLKKIVVDEQKILVSNLEGRVKTYDSLKGKLELKGHKYSSIEDITDLLGVRVVTFYYDEVDIIANLIEKNFIIDYDNSIDKRKMYEVDRFGYMSLHYVCQIPKTLLYDEKHPKVNEFKFEVQMRTCLQHTWATIFHDTGYKSDVEVPKEYIRKLARIEGLLEIADDEFLNIRDSINQYRNKIKSLVSKGEFKDISLNIDSYKDYLALDPYRTLINKIAAINNAQIEEVSYLRYYDVFITLGIKTLSDVEQMRMDNSEDAYKLAYKQLSGTDIDILSSTVAIQNIFIMYIRKHGGDRNEIKMLLQALNGKREITDTYVNKIIDQTKSILMI